MGMVACFASVDPITIDRLKADPDQVIDFLNEANEDGDPPSSIDIDKAWHCIHFMLTGSATSGPKPLADAVLGGEELGEDAGYGPARLMLPKAVRDVAIALSGIDEAAFRARYCPEAMQKADVYLADMCVRDGDEALDYLAEYYLSLVAFYQAAAERGDGAMLWIC